MNSIPAQEDGERLARFLAHAGIASRRHAEELIASGRVQVNGVTITRQGTRIHPEHDIVTVDGKPVHALPKRVYLALHKPVGYVTTVRDPQGRPTILDLLPAELRSLRVYPVGRLDIDTSGLLLLTNDGDFAQHLTQLVQGHPSESTLAALRSGVTIVEDNGRSHKTAPAQVHLLRQLANASWLGLTIHEGRKRQVRRMLSVVGHPVLELMRVGIGPLELGDIPPGKWRYLTAEEVEALQGSNEHSA